MLVLSYIVILHTTVEACIVVKDRGGLLSGHHSVVKDHVVLLSGHHSVVKDHGGPA